MGRLVNYISGLTRFLQERYKLEGCKVDLNVDGGHTGA